MNSSKKLPNFIRKDERGLFVEALNGIVWKNISYGIMKKGSVMGNHYHKKTSVYFFIIKGSVRIDSVDIHAKEVQAITLQENEGVIFFPNHSHAITFTQDSIFIMGKSEKYDQNNPDTFEYKITRKDYGDS